MAFDAFALMLAMLALGMLFARLRVLPANAADTLNLLALYVCLPAAMLTTLPKLHVDTSLLGLALVPWLLAGVSWGLLRLLQRWLGFRRDEFAALLMCVMLGNTSFIGYPMVTALLGQDALPYAVIYDQFGTFLLLSTVGLLVLASYSGERRPAPREMALRIAKFPPVWALLFGLTLMPEHPPAWIAAALERLAGVLLMLVMLAVGLTIRLRLPRDEIAPLATGLALKLLVLPLLALPLAWLFGLRAAPLHVAVLETAMPTMITAAAMTVSHGLAPRLAAALVGYSIVLSMATLPLWTFALQRFAS